MELKFRDLRADEIEVRIQQITDKGLIALIYKNARVDMTILDEKVGAMNWTREPLLIKDTLYCRVGIRDNDTGEWVFKSDCGTESNTEAEKGESSDSFKRACVNWGIGRELYSSPFIFIPADKATIRESNGKKKCYDTFSVEKIKIENKVITGLSIKNDSKGCRAFVWQKETKKEESKPKAEEPKSEAIVEKKYACCMCGEEIKPKEGKDGIIPVDQIIELSVKRSGRHMCADCLKKYDAMQKLNEADRSN